MVGRKRLSGSQQAVTYTSRRAGCRQAAEQDGQRTGGRPAGRPLARHSAAQRLSSTGINAVAPARFAEPLSPTYTPEALSQEGKRYAVTVTYLRPARQYGLDGVVRGNGREDLPG
jgi:hypothetical protein